jgi:hypothetical protein
VHCGVNFGSGLFHCIIPGSTVVLLYTDSPLFAFISSCIQTRFHVSSELVCNITVCTFDVPHSKPAYRCSLPQLASAVRQTNRSS